jgi:hypothetical protein
MYLLSSLPFPRNCHEFFDHVIFDLRCNETNTSAASCEPEDDWFQEAVWLPMVGNWWWITSVIRYHVYRAHSHPWDPSCTINHHDRVNLPLPLSSTLSAAPMGESLCLLLAVIVLGCVRFCRLLFQEFSLDVLVQFRLSFRSHCGSHNLNQDVLFGSKSCKTTYKKHHLKYVQKLQKETRKDTRPHPQDTCQSGKQ